MSRIGRVGVVLALAGALLMTADAAHAADPDPDDRTPPGSMTIVVIVPEHVVSPLPADPSDPTDDRLAGTGAEAGWLWAAGLGATGAVALGATLAARHRARARRA